MSQTGTPGNVPENRLAERVARWSVRSLLNCLVVACLLPGVIGAAGLLIADYRQQREELRKSTVQTTRALVQAVDSHLLRALAVAQVLSTSDALARNDLRTFHRRAREAVALVGLGTNAVLRDSSGQQLLNTATEFDAPLPGWQLTDEVRQVFATGRPAISKLFMGPLLKKHIVSVYVPVTLDGRVAYVLAIGILPERLLDLLASQNLPPQWIAGVLDPDLAIVARTVGQREFVGRKPPALLIEAMAREPQGMSDLTTLEGLPALVFYSRSEATGWSVAIAVPRHLLEGPLKRSILTTVIGMAALFAIGIGLAWLIGRHIAGSVTALIAPAAAIGAGESVSMPRVDVRESDELAAALGRAMDLLNERGARLAASRAELEEAHLLAGFGTWHWQPDSGKLSVSESIRTLSGHQITTFLDMKGTLIPERSWDKVQAALQQTLNSGKPFDIEIEVDDGNQPAKWLNMRCEAVCDDSGAVVALRGTVQDISERKLAEQRVRDAALHDPLTGLPNRALIFEHCTHLLAAAERGHGSGALLFIDLDRFKPINDVHGHETGDRVLQEVARRLRQCIRDEDLAGRLGGDEFVVVLPYMPADGQRAALVAQHIIDHVGRPIRVNALELTVTPSVGISYFPRHARDVNTLIHTADLAMYRAKQTGRGHYRIYTPELEQQAELVLSVEAALKQALRDDGLRLCYQPVVDLHSGKLVSVEALVRLQDANGRQVPPVSFIAIAESVGLIEQLGEWVIAEACRQHLAWRRQGLDITIAVNVSPLQFRQSTFAEKLGSMITGAGVEPGAIQIEITESAIMDSIDDAIALMRRIKALGVKMSMDDFGTGYSSLSNLTSLPIDKLKIDQSFVRRMALGDEASRTVTEAIIALGHSLKLEVVAEGVESAQTVDYLKRQHCDQAQGYWFSKPLSARELALWCEQCGVR
jgi:diguanylate cyclase (GGDEF)-like protein